MSATVLNEFEIIPINCLWAEPDDLVRKIRSINMDSGTEWAFEKRELNLKNVYFPAPPPGGRHLPRCAVWQPRSVSIGSVLIPNYQGGLIQLMRHLNGRFRMRYFSAFIARDYKKEGYCSFEHANERGERRNVHVIRDPKWKFFEKGEMMAFENIEYYRAKRIADRLTPAIVMEYLKSLGWDLNLEEFWECKGEAWFVAQTAFNP